jgi:hypothetical protein
MLAYVRRYEYSSRVDSNNKKKSGAATARERSEMRERENQTRMGPAVPGVDPWMTRFP